MTSERRTREQIDAEKASKPRPDLIPGTARTAVGAVLAYGYHKHGRCTWTCAGTEQARAETHIASAERHLAQLGDGYRALDESGHAHLAHAAAQLLIAIDCLARGQRAAASDECARGEEQERAEEPPLGCRWMPEQTQPLPEGWQWVVDPYGEDPYGEHVPWGAWNSADGYGLWAATPEEAAERAWEQVRAEIEQELAREAARA